MKFQTLEEGAQSTFAVILDKDDEFIAALAYLAKEKRLSGSPFYSTRCLSRSCARLFRARPKRISKNSHSRAGRGPVTHWRHSA